MESMRRSLDRSRQPGLKKPRLAEDQPNPSGASNPFVRRPPPAAAAAAAAASSRFRAAGDRDSGSNDTVRGGDAYHPQPLQQTQVQELVNQYKTALAELTFNSKPIITNLTIIAGENVSAAKAIAATVCNHIIEVPSEQKLPSLYLLDSIVKNIGRDYAKHFAPRLPEVFGKAYRQVDPPIQSSMRHLFGTWKNVFPVQCLQMIEEELGFSSAVNGSSSGTVTSRSDAQSQRPQHSIHVNPKYLERQQRLQQSGRAPTVESPEDIDRPERTSSIVASRPWADSAVKIHDIQRSQRIPPSPIQEKNIGQLYGDLEYETDTSRNSGLGSGLTGTRATEQGHGKPWYGEAEFVPRKLSDPRLGFSMKHRGADHLIPKATKAIHLQPTESVARRSDNNISTSWKNFEEEPEFVPRKLSDPRLGLSRKRGVADHLIPESTKAVHIQSAESIARRSDNSISTSWKNSEEEEFMWDMHSRLPDQDVANLSDNSRKDPWIPSDPEKLGFENRVRRPQVAHEVGSGFDRESSSDSLPTEQRERLSYGNRLPSPWRLQEASSGDELLFSGSTSNSSYAEANKARNGGFPSVTNSLSRITAGPAGTSSQQRFPPVRAASPPQRSSLHPAPPSALLPSRYLPRQLPNAADQDCSQVLPQSHQKVHQFSRSLLPQNVVNKFQSEDLQSSPAVASAQQDRQYPMDYGLSKSFGPSQKQNPILDSNARAPSTSGSSESDQSFQHTVGTSGGSSTSSLLAAVMKSGILTNITTGGLAKKSLQDSGQVASKSSTKALPPATTQVKSFVSQSTSTPSKRPVLRDAKSCISKVAQKEKQQQLPLVSPASLQPTSKESNPISNLLSSLLVKGLIKSEASPAPSCQVAPEPEKQTTTAVNSKAALVSSLSEPVATADEKCLAKPGAKSSSNIPKSNPVILKPHTKDCVNMPRSISVKTECLIGLKFKSNLVREFHPDVIDSLFDGLPHQCNVCGFRLKDKELLDKHLEWHSETQADADVRIGTRRWYVQTEDWISPKASIPPAVDSSLANVSQSATDGDACESVMDVDDATTPADEDQCVCVLCGELFEDYYSPQRNTWMFRGAVRMKIGSGNTDASSLNGPLVHLHCRSEGSSSELGLANIVKMEE